jgi:hypothetical protein
MKMGKVIPQTRLEYIRKNSCWQRNFFVTVENSTGQHRPSCVCLVVDDVRAPPHHLGLGVNCMTVTQVLTW